jgi:coenzyme F420-0:L-glutamate ligase / coenzyme F420-1:gamma-L-glutamate ligase
MLEVRPVEGLGEIREGDALGPLLADAAAVEEGDIVVVSHKVVSKAEGRVRSLADVEPGAAAIELAKRLGKDPRLVQVILGETRSVIRAKRGVLIVETKGGWICANAGVDSSNVGGEDLVALLPLDGDASARRIRAEIREAAGVRPAVVVADTFGRPWRVGQTDVAIGCAGLAALEEWRGRDDAHGRTLSATTIAVADEVASAADLVRPKDSGVPAAVLRGLSAHVTPEDGPGAAPLRRAEADDLFR